LLVFVNEPCWAPPGTPGTRSTRLNNEFDNAIARQNQVEAASDLARRAAARVLGPASRLAAVSSHSDEDSPST
jgi:hypothetical protein